MTDQAFSSKKNETASEFLMGVIEQFGNAEGMDILVVYTDEKKVIHAISNCPAVTGIGLAEFARHAALKKAFASV